MQIAILDDTLTDRKSLCTMIKQYFEERSLPVVISEYAQGEELLLDGKEKGFDLIFLDIVMDGKNGMQIAHEMREQGYKGYIIFITSSKEFAIEGYQVQALNYLVKPTTYEAVEQALSVCEQELRNMQEYIEVKEGRLMVKILLKDIQYTDYYNHYIQIHTKHHVYRTYLSFADFSKLLAGHMQFVSCYRNMIVNMDYVNTMDHQDFILHDGCHIPIAKAKRQEVRQQYADYLFEKLKR